MLNWLLEKLEELKKKEVADFFGGVVNDKR